LFRRIRGIVEFEELPGFNVKMLGDGENDVDGDVDRLRLDLRQVASVDAGVFGELLLADAPSVSEPSDVLGDGASGEAVSFQSPCRRVAISLARTVIANLHKSFSTLLRLLSSFRLQRSGESGLARKADAIRQRLLAESVTAS
jgi:hypothetical protein